MNNTARPSLRLVIALRAGFPSVEAHMEHKRAEQAVWLAELRAARELAAAERRAAQRVVPVVVYVAVAMGEPLVIDHADVCKVFIDDLGNEVVYKRAADGRVSRIW